MQTDPNWGNFLYDAQQDRLNLIDFGAAREYPVKFVDDYLRMVRSCALQDREDVILRSTRLGFLTGAHAVMHLACGLAGCRHLGSCGDVPVLQHCPGGIIGAAVVPAGPLCRLSFRGPGPPHR